MSLNGRGQYSIVEQSLSKEDTSISTTFNYPLSRPAMKTRAVGSMTVVAIILGGELGGLIVAFLHHFLNDFLDGKLASAYNQQWVRAAGNALAFVATTLMAASGCTALTQSMWYTVRRTSLSVETLDALFGLEKPWRLYRVELFTKAPLAVVICLLVASIPLTPIIAPTSLTVYSDILHNVPLSVPTVYLGAPYDINASMSLAKGYYISPSIPWRNAATRAFIHQGTVEWPSPCGATCNYTISYFSPALKCSDFPSSQIGPPEPNTLEDTPFTIWLGGWRHAAQFTVFNATTNSLYGSGPHDVHTLTAAYLPFTSVIFAQHPPDDSDRVPSGSFCSFYNATYTVSVRFSNGTQVTSVGVPEYHSPIIADRVNTNTDSPLLFPTINLRAIADSFTGHLRNPVIMGTGQRNMDVDQPAFFTNLFNIEDSGTTLVFTPRFSNFSRALEELMGNITLAYMELSGGRETVPVTMLSPVKYHYRIRTLWGVYTAALAGTTLCAAVGLYCLWADGIPATLDFSEFLVTTRNPNLDRILHHVQYARELDARIWKMKLRFGRLGQTLRTAFGVEDVDDITPVTRH